MRKLLTFHILGFALVLCFQKKLAQFLAEIFRNILLFTTFLLVSRVTQMDNISDKFHLSKWLAKHGCFYIFSEKAFGDLHPKSFSKHLLYTIFLLLFTVGTEFITSQKVIFNIIWCTKSQRFLNTSTFSHNSFSSFDSG